MKQKIDILATNLSMQLRLARLTSKQTTGDRMWGKAIYVCKVNKYRIGHKHHNIRVAEINDRNVASEQSLPGNTVEVAELVVAHIISMSYL